MGVVSETIEKLRSETSKAIVGQHEVMDQLFVAILANGHVLLEGVPGIAKTLMVRSLTQALNLSFRRIQFTPDLMPSDIIGTNVFDPRTVTFSLRQGPIFTQVMLADEINRTPPKTQAALLEAMEERHVTIDGERMLLPEPFLVFATQNPIEFEGTYPLPEAQQDRFLMKVEVKHPKPHEEAQVLRNFNQGFRAQELEKVGIQPVVDAEGLRQLREEVSRVTVEDKIFDYILAIVQATRDHGEILYGASPRAGLSLLACSKAVASIRGRDFVIPDDVKELALAVLRHRILLRADVDTQGVSVDEVLEELLEAQLVPR